MEPPRASQRWRIPTAIVTIALLNSSDSESSLAQIVPDDSLSNPSRVQVEGRTFHIEGGTQAQQNLFHSFDRFSVPTDTEARFEVDSSIANVLTRVTGHQASYIDGLLGVNGTANLFFLNPNGMIFGENARLDLNGSFFATTADALEFADGTTWNVRGQNTPQLSISVPLGLQWFPNGSGSIAVRGSGVNFGVPTNLPLTLPASRPGLQVAAGETLALLGGTVTLDRASLDAPGGRVEIAGIEVGRVIIDSAEAGVSTYDEVDTFADVSFDQSLVTANGLRGGSVAVRGRNIALANGTTVVIQNFSNSTAGAISIAASDRLELFGITPDGQRTTLLLNQTLSSGRGGDVRLSASRLALRDGVQVAAESFGSGLGGDVYIETTETVDVLGFASSNSQLFSNVSAAAYGSGNAGNLSLNTDRLYLADGGLLTSTTFGTGNGGTIRVRADREIDIVGVNPDQFLPSAITISTLGEGNSGNLLLETDRLSVREGGQLSASTLVSGAAGRIEVRARESIEVVGIYRDTIPSTIDSSAPILEPSLQAFLGVLAIPTGSTGDVTLRTATLSVRDGGIVSVNAMGEGDAGALRVFADGLEMVGGGLTASTKSGQGGSIVLEVEGSLQMHEASRIGVTAGGAGNGGNVAIAAETIVALDNSDIAANAVSGSGGNIDIATSGIFGAQFRDRPTSNSDITASSEFGLSGIVNIVTPNLSLPSGLLELTVRPLDPSRQVVSACIADENTFVVTGRGGIPEDPTQRLRTPTIWEDWRLTEIQSDNLHHERPKSDRAMSASSSAILVEANRWRRNAAGEVELFAETRPSWRVFQHCGRL
ncbi:filamentous hemagglutinin N-terminal domain-containing protein [Baaleninema sp.]|uniref:filamentous hemagglutinin N-terminal domain-containing protein n=1 Tax=Baaleninema sp. TaxID=3101197 RepID=UPI003CFDCDA8